MEQHCYIVIYEIKTVSKDYTAFYNALKSYAHWGKITGSSWAVVSELSSVAIRNNLSQYLDKGDRIMVIQSGLHAAWLNAIASNEWLKQNLVK